MKKVRKYKFIQLSKKSQNVAIDNYMKNNIYIDRHGVYDTLTDSDYRFNSDGTIIKETKKFIDADKLITILLEMMIANETQIDNGMDGDGQCETENMTIDNIIEIIRDLRKEGE
jgi:hypothetical protein